MADTSTTVRRTDHDGVAVVELHRPERRNALTGPMFAALAETVSGLSADRDVAAMVFCGAGGAFCSGLDLGEYRADPPPDWIDAAPQHILAAHQALAACAVPVVVALERFAINAGASLAMAGDLMVVGDDAFLQVMEAPMGMAAPMNVAWLVAKYPLATVNRIVLTGERFDGDQLLAMGLAHEVVPAARVKERAVELATQLADYPHGAGAQMKASVLRVAGATADERAAYFARADVLARWS